MNEVFSLELLVPGPQPDELKVDADMPAHKHGMLSAPVTVDLGGGRFRTDGMLLHMPGDWVVFVDIVRGEAVEHVEFPVTLEF